MAKSCIGNNLILTCKSTAQRIVIGKFGACAGQACVAIDYVLVEHKFISTLVPFLWLIAPIFPL